MKNQGNVTSPQGHSHLLVTDPKDMETYNLPNKEFKRALVRKLNEL